MCPKFNGPVKTQMSVTVFKSSLGSESHGKSSGRRRVFVQTETGCVLGMELDRSDNAHTVKRRLQIALNVPTEESSLTFGDMVLKNDLSAIRHDSPLLLMRNFMHRSSSTPCLSPTGRDIQQKDKSGPIEILGHSSCFSQVKLLVHEIVQAIKSGVDPLPVHSGLGGAYYFRNIRGESVAIIKPTDEEPFAPNNPKGFVGKALGQPGLKLSVRVGETGFREVAAYLLDYDHFANVPPTALVKVTHSIFNVNSGVNGNKNKRGKAVSKIASFQQYIPHDFDASDHGTSSFPVAAVHRIGILDIRILNTDRHAGNLLVKKLDGVGRLGRDIQQKDKSGPIEILGHSSCFSQVKLLVHEIVQAIKSGVDPLPVHSGLGGAYYFRNIRGESVAIIKPTDEEPFAPNNPKGFVGKALGQPGLKLSVRVGETGFREVAAYLLDYDHFANVPPTALVKVTHSIFNVNSGVNGNKNKRGKAVSKIASFQQYIPHDFDASDHGTSSFPVAAVHRIGILDIRILNTDRHAGNLLVKKLDGVGRFGQVELIPIDHGLCLPESLEDPYFEWIHWPQASIPFSEDELEYIKKLDPIRDSEMLRSELPMIREACLRVLVMCTIFLKEAAAYGLCLAEIGEMMSREFRSGEEEPSELELVCIEARMLISEREVISPKSEVGIDEFQFAMDYEDDSLYHYGFGSGNGRSPLSTLDEIFEEELENEEHVFEKKPSVLKLSASLKNISLGEKKQKYTDFRYLGNSSSGHRSANEQLPVSASFVKVADMNEEEWTLFREKFQELLAPAFAKRKSITLAQRQTQRLGTSCQF